MRSSYSHHRLLSLTLIAVGLSFSGCSWLHSLKQTEDGPALSKWRENMRSSIGSTAEKGEAKEKSDSPSKSLFFDKRSHAVEKSMGYAD